MQHEITAQQRLLNAAGNIAEPGFAKKLYWIYDRADIKAPKWRIKEWDYYYIGCADYGLCLTISDAGFVSSLSASVLTFGEHPTMKNGSAMGWFPLGKLHLPATSEKGDVAAKVGKADMRFANDGKIRRLSGSIADYAGSKDTLRFDLTLTDFPEESMVIATPFKKKAHFYYNQKINCMRAEGFVTYGYHNRTYEFDPAESFAVLDWGRGVWTYDNTWYWGSASGLADGVPFGFNIGYGFGDTSAATENMLFYNGRAHKLSHVKFCIPGEETGSPDYLAPWTFSSDDGRFEMDFVPALDRKSKTDFKLLMSDQHQVFGRFTGTVVLDDGTPLEIRGLPGFAEKVRNKW